MSWYNIAASTMNSAATMASQSASAAAAGASSAATSAAKLIEDMDEASKKASEEMKIKEVGSTLNILNSQHAPRPYPTHTTHTSSFPLALVYFIKPCFGRQHPEA